MNTPRSDDQPTQYTKWDVAVMRRLIDLHLKADYTGWPITLGRGEVDFVRYAKAEAERKPYEASISLSDEYRACYDGLHAHFLQRQVATRAEAHWNQVTITIDRELEQITKIRPGGRFSRFLRWIGLR